MKFSAGKAVREWAFWRWERGRIGVVALLVLAAAPAQASLSVGKIPLPMPRPAEAPSVEQPPAAAEKPAVPDKPAAEQRPAEPPPPSACRLALTDAIAIAPSVPDIKGPGACGGPDMVHLEAVILADKTRVPLKPGGTMRCTMAAAVADWIRTDMAPLAASLGTKLMELDNFDSFDCRGRNRVVGAKMSEHGRANALDLRGIKLANGQNLALTERDTPRASREQVLRSLCTRFSTVLGPGSDGYHEDHIHIDLAERRGNYKLCQWDVWDPLPPIAPLLPAERPADAPPREGAEPVAAKPPEAAPAEPPAAAAPVAEAEPEAAEPEQPPVKPKSKAKPRKRRAEHPPFPMFR